MAMSSVKGPVEPITVDPDTARREVVELLTRYLREPERSFMRHQIDRLIDHLIEMARAGDGRREDALRILDNLWGVVIAIDPESDNVIASIGRLYVALKRLPDAAVR